MNKNNLNKNNLFIILMVVFVILFLIAFTGIYSFGFIHSNNYKFSGLMHNSMNSEVEYGCCVQNGCVFCLTDQKHEGLCDCFEDVVNGQAPCNECVDSILEGNGNKYLAKYFAKSISEKKDDMSLLTLKKIIFEKYNITVSEQY